MKRCLVLLVALATIPAIYALPPGEFPLAPVPIGFAPYDRQNVHVAANDQVALAAWEDFRVDPAAPPRIWAARINRETNKVIDATGFVIAKLPAGGQLRDVATDGTDFLVAWTEADRLRLAKVTAAGEVIAAPDPNATVEKVSLVFIGGFGYAVFATSPTALLLERADAVVLVVDRGGHVTRPLVTAVASDGVVDIDAAASADHNRLFLVWSDLADGDVHAFSYNTSDITQGVFAPAPAVGQTSPPHNGSPVVRMATSGGEIFAAWLDVESNPSLYRVRRFDGNGNPLGPAAVLAPPTEVGPEVDVVWDGAQYVVAFKADDSALRAVRFAADGTRIDATPLLAAQPAVNGFSLAVSPASPDTLVTWLAAGASGAQVLAHVFAQTGSINVTQDLTLSQSFAERSDATVVWRGDHYLGAWRDTTNLSRAVVGRFTADGVPLDGSGVSISVGAFAAIPSLASNGRTAFIAWRDSNGVAGSFIDEGGGVQRRFFDFQGGVPSVNWNGQQYAVVWRATTGDLVGLRLRGDGSLIDQQAILTGAQATGDPVIGWTGNSYVAVYSQNEACAPFCAPETKLWAQMISPALTAIGSPIQLSDPTAATPVVGSGPAGALVVWPRTIFGPVAVGPITQLRAARIVNGAVLDPINGFAIGSATYASVYGTAAGWGVVNGPYVWDVARNGAVTPRVVAFPFVPAGAHSSVVLGGPAPLVVYRREPVGSEQMMQVVARYFFNRQRERAARP